MRSGTHQKTRKHRDHGEREHQRAQQGEHDGERERPKHLAFEPFEAEERQEHYGDDEDAGEYWYRDLGGGAVDEVQARDAFRRAPKLGVHVLDHHHGRVHQDADGDGEPAERHEVGGDAEDAHHQEGGQHSRAAR